VSSTPAPARLQDLDDVYFARAQTQVRRALARLALDWRAATDDVTYLPLAEVREAARRGRVPVDLAPRAAAARAERAHLARFAPPLQITNGRAVFAAPPDAHVLRGRGTGGRVRGRVSVLAPDAPRLAAGEIVVCAAALPTLAPLVAGAAGLVVEHDGLLGHGAALARELGLPSVLGCVGALTALRDGDEVWLDGEAGVVLRLGGSVRG
jgi:pyruvate,water dikinase